VVTTHGCTPPSVQRLHRGCNPLRHGQKATGFLKSSLTLKAMIAGQSRCAARPQSTNAGSSDSKVQLLRDDDGCSSGDISGNELMGRSAMGESGSASDADSNSATSYSRPSSLRQCSSGAIGVIPKPTRCRQRVPMQPHSVMTHCEAPDQVQAQMHCDRDKIAHRLLSRSDTKQQGPVSAGRNDGRTHLPSMVQCAAGQMLNAPRVFREVPFLEGGMGTDTIVEQPYAYHVAWRSSSTAGLQRCSTHAVERSPPAVNQGGKHTRLPADLVLLSSLRWWPLIVRPATQLSSCITVCNTRPGSSKLLEQDIEPSPCSRLTLQAKSKHASVSLSRKA
jgi:hypothetical protein